MFNPDFPPGGDLEQAFSEEYYVNVQANAFRAARQRGETDPSVPAFVAGLERVEHLLGRKGRILDVGAAFGAFLEVARDRGWDPSGVELSPFSSAVARETHGFEIYTGDLTRAPYAEGSFDCITFWDVIEHVQSPAANLDRAHALLKPDGVLLMTTDNFDCLFSDLGRAAYALSLHRFTYGLDRLYIPYNRTYFTEASFRSLLDARGFRTASFAKMEYPISKINLTVAERALVSTVYGLAKALHREAQFTAIAAKSERVAGASPPTHAVSG